MTEAEPVIRAVLPDANVPNSVRSTGVPVAHGSTAELHAIVDGWLATHDGIACVIGDPGFTGTARLHSVDAEHSKGLEFDLVVLVDPDTWGEGIEGQIDRYVAMTRGLSVDGPSTTCQRVPACSQTARLSSAMSCSQPRSIHPCLQVLQGQRG